MTKTVSAAEAKNRFGAILRAARAGDEIIVARHGKGDVAIISAQSLDELHALRQKEQRAAALRDLAALAKETSERNQDLSEEESIAMAVQIGRELFDALANRGDISGADTRATR